MKHYTNVLLTSAVVSVALWSCSSERNEPWAEAEQTSPSIGMLTISPICSEIETFGFISQPTVAPLPTLPASQTINYCPPPNGGLCGQPWGSVSTYFSPDNFVVTYTLQQGWVIDIQNSLYTTSNSIQFDQSGYPIPNADWNQLQTTVNTGQFTQVFEFDDFERDAANCFSYSARLAVYRTNFLGAPLAVSRRTLWIYNDQHNIPGPHFIPTTPYVIPFCWAFCPVEPDTICTPYLTGLPSSAGQQCTTLSPDVSSLTTSAVSYQWSTGATTASISVCPTADAYVSVTITEVPSRVPVAAYVYKLTGTDVSCQAGNSQQHKVVVCHRPPGNPANVQEICIDWGGVPAHVARYRAPGSNPNQGHDSGCEIGACGASPCN